MREPQKFGKESCLRDSQSIILLEEWKKVSKISICYKKAHRERKHVWGKMDDIYQIDSGSTLETLGP